MYLKFKFFSLSFDKHEQNRYKKKRREKVENQIEDFLEELFRDQI